MNRGLLKLVTTHQTTHVQTAGSREIHLYLYSVMYLDYVKQGYQSTQQHCYNYFSDDYNDEGWVMENCEVIQSAKLLVQVQVPKRNASSFASLAVGASDAGFASAFFYSSCSGEDQKPSVDYQVVLIVRHD